MTRWRGRWRQFADDLPGEFENFLSLQVREEERVSAVNDLADIYRALGVLTQVEALREIERMRGMIRSSSDYDQKRGE